MRWLAGIGAASSFRSLRGSQQSGGMAGRATHISKPPCLDMPWAGIRLFRERAMRIDIHTHTKRSKKGDAATREISPGDFCEKLAATDVKIIAITNHNVFDFAQYSDILTRVAGGIQVWPGIELDIEEHASKGHLLVIVSPGKAVAFDERVKTLTSGSNPDDFGASITVVLETFDSLGPLYVAHYQQKKPELSSEALAALVAGTSAPDRVIKEVTNSISAGIYISHGHASIYGSDVSDWERYEELARDLPELRLPVESFEHFCLLLEKDATTINTALDRKLPEELVLQPFEDESFLKLTVYNDINVVFGAKGTGKSCILRAIEKHYSTSGVDARVFESASDRLDDIFDVKGKELRLDLASNGINDCTREIKFLRNATEKDATPLSKFYNHYSSKVTNRNAKRIRIKDIDTEDERVPRRKFEEYTAAAKQTTDFLEFLRTNGTVQAELADAEAAELDRLLLGLVARLRAKSWEQFSGWKEIAFLNATVKVFRSEVARKTGSPAKPTTTGLRAYAANRFAIEREAQAIVDALKTILPVEEQTIGSLGENKGELCLRTEFRFQDGSIRDGSMAPTSKVRKSTQKDFSTEVLGVLKAVYQDNLFERVARLNAIEEVESIKSLRDLVSFKRYFILEGRPYAPSSGEASMVMLEKELRRDGDIYILDEPERSLGNEYISQVIVPLIKGHARAGKKVFISTHDANIAVRTLPYCSVYRAHDASGYKTYIGNPFSNHLVNVIDSSECLDWRLISMRTLEGGESAFGERSRIYGNS